MPRGRGIDRSLQLRAARLYEADRNTNYPVHDPISVRQLADQLGVSKSTVHRYVNQDALNADRRRSQNRRDQIRRGTRRP